MTDITRLAQRLTSITRFRFTSSSGAQSHCAWNGSGQGSVCVSQAADGLRFHEQGQFRLEQGNSEIAFSNVYRWSLHEDRLALFHERRGKAHAVWLFDLTSEANGTALVSHAPHLCGADRYMARLEPQHDGFDLEWRIHGPRKDEHLVYRYRNN